MSDVEILPGGAWDYPPGVTDGDIDEAFGDGEPEADTWSAWEDYRNEPRTD